MAKATPLPTDSPRLRNVIIAAQYMGISRNTCWKLVKDGNLPHVRIGARVLIDRADLDRFIDANRVNATR